MPKKTKKFIDRKHATTFSLVHRSQQDPLTADENAPQRVLMPQKPKKNERIDEQHKYGIYYDDDYNYLQHLREGGTMEWEKIEYKSKENGNLSLPSSVFASNVEEDVGLLNKAAPESGFRVDLDPDIVAALNDDFSFSDPGNELEDNFIELANAQCSDEELGSNESIDYSSDFGSEEEDEVASLEDPEISFKDEETKSRFSKHSLTSTRTRSELESLLDRKFEMFYAKHYNASQIGALDDEIIEGHIPLDSEYFLKIIEDFQKEGDGRKPFEDPKEKIPIPDYVFARNSYEYVPKPQAPTRLPVLPSYANQPGLIAVEKKPKIKTNKKTGIPIDVLDANKLTSKRLEALNDENTSKQKGPKSICAESVISKLSALSIRPKDESNEDKRNRKKLLKEYRKERRLEKKANRQAFKVEAERQQMIAINNRNNLQGNKIV